MSREVARNHGGLGRPRSEGERNKAHRVLFVIQMLGPEYAWTTEDIQRIIYTLDGSKGGGVITALTDMGVMKPTNRDHRPGEYRLTDLGTSYDTAFSCGFPDWVSRDSPEESPED